MARPPACGFPFASLSLGIMNDVSLERAAACALNRIFGYEPRISQELIAHFGSAAPVFSLSEDELFGIFGPGNRHRTEICTEALDNAAAELDRLERRGCRFISCTEEAFPALLKECPDSPAGLYIRSSSPVEEIFLTRPAVSIVGTRDISLYGKEWCPKIVEVLANARQRPTVVSGLAIGVDVTAHLAAMGYSLPTIAVLPTGIDSVYPLRHSTVADKIAAEPGCALISDFPPGTSPEKQNFLRRNRIIAGMSGATILVESKLHGGGMITAQLAHSYGRDVFALPGRVEDLRSQGCNELIRTKVAEPLSSLPLLPEALGLGCYNRRRVADFEQEVNGRYGNIFTDRREALVEIAHLIRKRRGMTADDICAATGRSYQEVSYLIGILESDAFIDVNLLGQCTIHTKFA